MVHHALFADLSPCTWVCTPWAMAPPGHAMQPWPGRRCGRLPALYAAERKWCMWHQDCCKADFFVVTQIDMLHDDCWVDRQDHYDFDLSETPVGHRVLDPVHANKNSLRGILRQLYKYRDANGRRYPGFRAHLQAR